MQKRTFILSLIVVVSTIIIGFAWYQTTPPSFTLHVTTRPFIPPGQQEALQAIPGQQCIFLITVENDGGSDSGIPVTLFVSVPTDLAKIVVQPHVIIPGQVAEITVTPRPTSVNQDLTVTVTGTRNHCTREEAMTIEVLPGDDGLENYATEMRDRFIPWLTANHTEFGISNGTVWTSTIVNPQILVVMHYMFLSEEWELYLTWHVTIPPHDWTRIYLRQRFTDTRPSHAFEISSVTNQDTPHSIIVPDWV